MDPTWVEYGTWKSGTRNQAKEEVLGRTSRGHPGVIRADILAQNFGQGGQNPGKTSISAWPEGADVHGPKGFPKTSVRETLGLNFRSLENGPKLDSMQFGVPQMGV